MVQLGRFAVGRDRTGSQTQYLSACGVIPGTSFRSPEGNAKAICEPPVCTANWHTCPPAPRTERSRFVAPSPPSPSRSALQCKAPSIEADFSLAPHFSIIIPSARSS